jgi:hypothetical protein
LASRSAIRRAFLDDRGSSRQGAARHPRPRCKTLIALVALPFLSRLRAAALGGLRRCTAALDRRWRMRHRLRWLRRRVEGRRRRMGRLSRLWYLRPLVGCRGWRMDRCDCGVGCLSRLWSRSRGMDRRGRRVRCMHGRPRCLRLRMDRRSRRMECLRRRRRLSRRMDRRGRRMKCLHGLWWLCVRLERRSRRMDRLRRGCSRGRCQRRGFGRRGQPDPAGALAWRSDDGTLRP